MAANQEEPKGKERGDRYRIYFSVAILCYIASCTLVVLRTEIGEPQPLSLLSTNGFAYYAYLPSALIDSDLDLRNQSMAWSGLSSSAWVVSGRYPIGVALTLLLPFLCAHALSLLAFGLTGAEIFAPTGFTALYELFCVAFIMAFWALGAAALHRMLRRRFQVHERSAIAGILLYWLGSYFLWYFLLDPFWGHVISATWVVFVVCLIAEISADLDDSRFVPWRWGALAFATAMAIVTRLSDVFLFPFFIYLAYRLAGRKLLPQALAGLPLIALGMFPLVLQWAIWQTSVAASPLLRPEVIGYGAIEGFRWGDPVIGRMLFSSLNGLFFWSPVLIAAVWGLAWQFWRRAGWRDPLLVSLVLAAAVLTYINGSWYAWYFGVAVGARAFLDVSVIFSIGFVFAFEHLRTLRAAARGWIASALVFLVLTGYVLMALHHFGSGWRPSFDYIFEWESRFYGSSSLRYRVTSEPAPETIPEPVRGESD